MIDWLEQNNEDENDFHEFRSKGLGGSDMPIVMGVSPWKTPFKLWLDKTGIKPDRFEGNWATERGNRLEPEVRDWFNERFGCNTSPERRVSKENEIFRANADGFCEKTGMLIEIKCPGLADHRKALEGGIPEKYIPQIHWLMMIFERSCITYISYSDNKELKEAEQYAVNLVGVNLEYQAELKAAALKFWHHVQFRTSPSEEETYLDSIELTLMLAQHANAKKQMDEWKIKVDELAEEIKELIPTSRVTCDNASIAWTERKGNIDYKKVPELKDVDLEKYRKKPTRYFAIKHK